MECMDEAYFVLRESMSLLASFMSSLDDGRKKQAEAMYNTFLHSIETVQTRQAKDLAQLRNTGDQDRFSKMLAHLCANNQLNLRKKKHLGHGCPGAIGNRLLYLSLNCLEIEARRYFKDSSITGRAITIELRRNGLLEMDSSGASTKKVNGVRYLQIPIDRLGAYSGNCSDLAGSHEFWDALHGKY